MCTGPITDIMVDEDCLSASLISLKQCVAVMTTDCVLISGSNAMLSTLQRIQAFDVTNLPFRTGCHVIFDVKNRGAMAQTKCLWLTSTWLTLTNELSGRSTDDSTEFCYVFLKVWGGLFPESSFHCFLFDVVLSRSHQKRKL